MKRTETRLADGRALIYFDERDDATRADHPDERDLPARPPLPELRHDPLLNEWVSVAAVRQTRTFLPPSTDCPLCPSTPERRSEIPAPDYDVAVFENRFPSFANHVPPGPGTTLDDGLVTTRTGGGRCEVVCFTSDHNSSFAALGPDRVRTVVEAWADRTAELSAMPDVAQVFCFENRGEEIGVTLHHPHGQIYAYPFVTPRTARMMESAQRHAEATGGRNLFTDLLDAERESGERVVAGNGHWTAFVPAAARWPFEVHLYPHRRVADIPALSDAERDAFGPLYLDVLGRLDRLFDVRMPYISGWYQAPTRTGRDLAHLHLELFTTRRAPGKLKYLAGSESAMGVFVNDIRPEHAAELLRRA